MSKYEIVLTNDYNHANEIEATSHSFEGDFVVLKNSGKDVFIFPKHALISMEIKND